jgi:hypothetical protein
MEPCGIRGFRNFGARYPRIPPSSIRATINARVISAGSWVDLTGLINLSGLIFARWQKSGHVARMEPCGIRGFFGARYPRIPPSSIRATINARVISTGSRVDLTGLINLSGLIFARWQKSGHVARMEPCGIRGFRSALFPDSAKLHPGYHQRSCHQHRITGRPDRFDKPVRSDFCALAKSGHVARMEPCGIRGFRELRSALSPDSAKLHPGYHQRSCHQHRITVDLTGLINLSGLI